jgi:hypothetical protein
MPIGYLPRHRRSRIADQVVCLGLYGLYAAKWPESFRWMPRSPVFSSNSGLAERYFAGRTDGLRPPSNAEELIVATA